MRSGSTLRTISKEDSMGSRSEENSYEHDEVYNILNSDEGTLNDACRAARRGKEELKIFVFDLIESECGGEVFSGCTMAGSLLRMALSEVRWGKLCDELVGDIIGEDEDEDEDS